MTAPLLLLLALPLPQDDDVAGLIRRLGADAVEEREAAAGRLKEIGDAAVPALERAAGGEGEAAARARLVLRAIGLRRTLTPALLRTLPGIEDRLALDDDHAWLEALLEAAGAPEGGRTHPDLGGRDLRPLWERAARGARTGEEKAAVLQTVWEWGTRDALRAILPWLDDPDPDTRYQVATILGEIPIDEAAERWIPRIRDEEKEEIRVLAMEASAALGNRNAIPAILERLGKEDPLATLTAVQALGTLRAKEAVASLTLLLRDSNPGLRQESARVLAELSGNDAAPLLLEAMREGHALHRFPDRNPLLLLDLQGLLPELREMVDHPESAVRISALQTLGAAGDADALPLIRGRLGDREPSVRLEAVLALQRAGSEETIPELLRLLHHDEVPLRRAAVRSLRTLGAREAAPDIARCVEDPAVGLREEAIGTLAALRAPETVPALVGRLLDPEERLRHRSAMHLVRDFRDACETAVLPLLDRPEADARRQAVEILGAAGARGAIPRLRELLEDPVESVRLAAADALRELGAKGLAPFYLERMATPAGRRRAVTALGQIGGAEAEAALLRLLKKGEEFDRFQAELALVEMRSPAMRRILTGRLESPDDAVRHQAAFRLSRFGAEEAVPVLLEVLRDAAAATLVEAGTSLKRLDSRKAVPGLVAILHDPGVPGRKLALDALVHLGGREAADDFLALAREGDPLRYNALWAVGELGLAKGIPELRRHLDQDIVSRQQAAWSLGELGAREAAADLLPLLEDPVPAVRKDAARALVRLGRREGVPLVLATEAPGRLSGLNALRSPRTWARLAEGRFEGRIAGAPGALLKRLAKAAGLTLEAPDDPRFADWAGRDLARPEGAHRRFSPAATLDRVTDLSDTEYVVEPGRLRLLPRGEALALWEAWWAAGGAPISEP